MATMFAVVPVGKITKASHIASLTNKFSGAVDDVLAKVASSSFKVNSGVKLIHVALGDTYTSFAGVASYIHKYGKLPDNYITKKAAREFGWRYGDVSKFAKGKSIGGSPYKNVTEPKLPEKIGRLWFESDIDNYGQASRGANRILYSNDGLIFKTTKHYESFTQIK